MKKQTIFYFAITFVVLLVLSILTSCSNDSIIAQINKISTATPNMVLIEAGSFEMGSSYNNSWHKTHIRTEYTDAYYIDKCEVTVAQFEMFMDDTGYTRSGKLNWYMIYPKDAGSMPALNPATAQRDRYHPRRLDPNKPVLVTWAEANAYAFWAKKRLPTEIEWEKSGTRWVHKQ